MAHGADLERSAYLLGALELVDRCRPLSTPLSSSDQGGGDASDDLFGVCGAFVRVLSSGSCNRPALFFAFEWELLVRHGMTPEVTDCVTCGRLLAERDISSLRFSPAEGGVVCGTCSARGGVNEGRPVGAEALECLRTMARSENRLETAATGSAALARPMRRELGALLHRFLGYHLPGYRLPAALDLLRAGKENTR